MKNVKWYKLATIIPLIIALTWMIVTERWNILIPVIVALLAVLFIVGLAYWIMVTIDPNIY